MLGQLDVAETETAVKGVEGAGGRGAWGHVTMSRCFTARLCVGLGRQPVARPAGCPSLGLHASYSTVHQCDRKSERHGYKREEEIEGDNTEETQWPKPLHCIRECLLVSRSRWGFSSFSSPVVCVSAQPALTSAGPIQRHLGRECSESPGYGLFGVALTVKSQ